MLRFFIHYGFHFIVPFIIGYLFFKKSFLKVSLLLILGILIDFDHLLANPIYDSTRCSIAYHPLHSYIAIIIYIFLFSIKKTRLLGLALLLHILADTVDCVLLFLKI